MNIDLLPPNLMRVGVKRRGNGRTPDLETIALTPYPVLMNYKQWCRVVGLDPFAGGSWSKQGPSDVAGYITSGYRDEIINGNESSPHPFAIASDVAVCDVGRQLAVVPSAVNYFSRVGIYPGRGFVHLDLAPDDWIRKYNKRRFWCKTADAFKSFDSLTDLTRYAEGKYVV